MIKDSADGAGLEGVTGYLHPRYAESFAGVGRPRELPHCGGWIIERSIPGTDLHDGMGCYPVFACRDWSRLALDLPALADRLVTLVLVTDPFGDATEEDLGRSFDVVRAYKPHYVTDLSRPGTQLMARTHRRNTARALGRVRVETCDDPLGMLDEWKALYDQLIARHAITGVPAFSRAAFARQLSVPGLVMFRATAEGVVVGLHLWYVQGDVAYGHLGATSARGYELMASYALYSHAVADLRDRVRWLDLGSSPGAPGDAADDGLRRFKAGWATAMRQTHLCGRVFQPDAYARLVVERGVSDTDYFPAYRRGEFGDGARRRSLTPVRASGHVGA